MLEIASLDGLVAQFFDSVLLYAPTPQARYAEICSASHLPTLHLTQYVLCRYSAWLAAQIISFRTIVLSVGAALPPDSPLGLRPTNERDGSFTVRGTRGQTPTGTGRNKHCCGQLHALAFSASGEATPPSVSAYNP